MKLSRAIQFYNFLKPAFLLGGSLFILLLVVLLCSHNSWTQEVCRIQQITSETDGQSSRPSINSNGNFVAFRTGANINDGNPDGNSEIYLYNNFNGIFTQVTVTTVGITNNDPSINSSGTRIVFHSDGNFNGNNLDGNDEIFLFDSSSGLITQITDTNSGGNFTPSISGNGNFVAFQSDSNISGGNSEGNSEIFLYNISTNTFSQLTDEQTGNSFNASINENGTRIAFQSSADINGTNPEGNHEIYLADTNTDTIISITKTTVGGNTGPSIDGLGTRIAFIGRANINGGNPNGNPEIFLFDLANNSFSQVTSTTTNFESKEPNISTNGLVIAFNSPAGLDGGTEGVNQFYLFDTGSGILTQVSETTSGQTTNPDTNSNGSITAFQSGSNIGGRNPEGNTEIYIATCPINIVGTVPTISKWGLIAMAGMLGIVGFMVIRRRKARA